MNHLESVVRSANERRFRIPRNHLAEDTKLLPEKLARAHDMNSELI